MARRSRGFGAGGLGTFQWVAFRKYCNLIMMLLLFVFVHTIALALDLVRFLGLSFQASRSCLTRVAMRAPVNTRADLPALSCILSFPEITFDTFGTAYLSSGTLYSLLNQIDTSTLVVSSSLFSNARSRPMTVLTYHSTLISDQVSAAEAVGNTSSQIFLSRGVAGPRSLRETPDQTLEPPAEPLLSIFESSSRHIMTLGEPAHSTMVSYEDLQSAHSEHERTSRYVQSQPPTDESCIDVAESGSVVPPPAACGETHSDRGSPIPNASPPSGESTPSSVHSLGHGFVVKPPASSTSGGSNSAYGSSSPDSGGPTEDEGQSIYKDKGKGVDRGRAAERSPRYANPLARAESSHPRKPEAAIEIDGNPIQRFVQGTSVPSKSVSRNGEESTLMEPYPPGSISPRISDLLSVSSSDCSSEVLSVSSSSSSGTATPLTVALWTNYDILAAEDLATEGTEHTLSRPGDVQHLRLAPTWPPETASYYMPDIQHSDYLAAKSSSPAWGQSDALAAALTPPNAASTRLPTEILQQIFYQLAPADFNAARRTCRTWMMASLDRNLLSTILRRSGWSNSIPYEVPGRSAIADITDEWLMSKRLARECALSPGWTGNGVKVSVPTGEQSQSQTTEASSPRRNAFLPTATTDFTDVGVGYSTAGRAPSGCIFTVSTCTRFLMVANGCLVYIYELNRVPSSPSSTPDSFPGRSKNPESSGAICPVASIICPRRVLACSMDTSSQRYAIAVLMDGRMGLVCDITVGVVGAANRRQRNSFRAQAHFQQPDGDFNVLLTTEDKPNHDPQGTWETWNNAVSTHVSFTTKQRKQTSVGAAGGDTGVANPGQSSSNSKLDSATETPRSPGSMPHETSQPTLYRSLCSSDDPPRSVAICPQRRCVAFGCSSGIELHWIDALTGQDLNRWFPLTSPSDYLYFLPPRRGIDSSKKLRLISSAARPSGSLVGGIAEGFSSGRRKTNDRFWSRLHENPDQRGLNTDARSGSASRFWHDDSGSFGRTGISFGGRGSYRQDSNDHYRAVPLSDGYHILFTDPGTGFLCLGSDAPIGGPTKLLRKIWFKGPDEGEGGPIVYTAGSDLTWGVRIVAAYPSPGNPEMQSIWLFSVPPDVFADSQAVHGLSPTTGASIFGTSSSNSAGDEPPASSARESLRRQNGGSEWMDWWPDDNLQDWLENASDPVPGTLRRRGLWPIQIHGQQIGTCAGVVDLMIDAGPQMTVWGFSCEGIATVWQIDTGGFNGNISRSFVMRDGAVRAADENGDIEMPDADTELKMPTMDADGNLQVQSSNSFDGAESSPILRDMAGFKPTIPVHLHPAAHGQTVQDLSLHTDLFPRNLTIRVPEGSHDFNQFWEAGWDHEDLGMEGWNDVEHGEQGWRNHEIGQEVMFRAPRWMGRAYIGADTWGGGNGDNDVVEELTGIARIDIEVR